MYTEHRRGACAWATFALLTGSVLGCPLAWVPLLCALCHDVEHSCPDCGAHIGEYTTLLCLCRVEFSLDAIVALLASILLVGYFAPI